MAQTAFTRYGHLPNLLAPNHLAAYYPQSNGAPVAGSSLPTRQDSFHRQGNPSTAPRPPQMNTSEPRPVSRAGNSRSASRAAPSPVPVALPFRLSAQPSSMTPENNAFLAKLLAADKMPRQSTPLSAPSPFNEHFSATPTGMARHSNYSTPPPGLSSHSMSSMTTSLNPTPAFNTLQPAPTLVPSPGGEMERIRQAAAREQQDLESRRPDYLHRQHRPESESTTPLGFPDAPTHPTVGIQETPNKGRRISLFQETSEESFEESLMAGGYGRYRTAEWVRQPQPSVVDPTGVTTPARILSALERNVIPPLSEREQKKRKRLEAFKSSNSTINGPCTLFPVELEGKGRVLLDIPNETAPPEPYIRKRAANRRRKRGEQPREHELTPPPEAPLDSPNWPDEEFPWRMRTEERAENTKHEEQERLMIIENYLARDTDDEDDDEEGPQGYDEGAAIPSSSWGVIFDEDRPTPSRRGRGKMIPLAADPTQAPAHIRQRSYFPSDPADARAALLSKRSVRELAFRNDRKLRSFPQRQPDQICICRGTDDGRQLVECEVCRIWFHLDCLGIEDVAALGPEDRPWYCSDCRTDSDERRDVDMRSAYREPTFVPTDEAARVRRVYNAPFLLESAPIQDSPLPSWRAGRLPKTPSRPEGGGLRDDELEEEMRPDPRFTTPKRRRVVGSGGTDETPFDPTSTPSRGVTLGKHGQGGNLGFQTPSRKGGSSRLIAGPSSSSGVYGSLEGSPLYARFPTAGIQADYSPVYRTSTRGCSPKRARLE